MKITLPPLLTPLAPLTRDPSLGLPSNGVPRFVSNRTPFPFGLMDEKRRLGLNGHSCIILCLLSLNLCRQFGYHILKASVGGTSQVEKDPEARSRTCVLYQTSGLCGNCVLGLFCEGYPGGFMRQRDRQNQNPKIGDKHQDYPGYFIDIKTSAMRTSSNPLHYNLFVRASEMGLAPEDLKSLKDKTVEELEKLPRADIVFIQALVPEYMDRIEEWACKMYAIPVFVVGAARSSELTFDSKYLEETKTQKGGPQFRYKLPCSQLHPLVFQHQLPGCFFKGFPDPLLLTQALSRQTPLLKVPEELFPCWTAWEPEDREDMTRRLYYWDCVDFSNATGRQEKTRPDHTFLYAKYGEPERHPMDEEIEYVVQE